MLAQTDRILFISTFKTIDGGLTGNIAGCPSLDAAQASTLRNQLQEVPSTVSGSCPAGVADCFANANVKAIVLQIDSSLLNVGTKKSRGIEVSGRHNTVSCPQRVVILKSFLTVLVSDL